MRTRDVLMGWVPEVVVFVLGRTLFSVHCCVDELWAESAICGHLLALFNALDSILDCFILGY